MQAMKFPSLAILGGLQPFHTARRIGDHESRDHPRIGDPPKRKLSARVGFRFSPRSCHLSVKEGVGRSIRNIPQSRTASNATPSHQIIAGHTFRSQICTGRRRRIESSRTRQSGSTRTAEIVRLAHSSMPICKWGRLVVIAMPRQRGSGIGIGELEKDRILKALIGDIRGT